MSRTLLAVTGLTALMTVGCAAGPIEIAGPADVGQAIPVEDLPFEGTPVIDTAPFSAQLVVDVERQHLFAGSYVSEFAGPAWRWTATADIAESDGYGYLAVGAVGEPGSRVCSELLQTPEGTMNRSFSAGERPGSFVPNTTGDDLVSNHGSVFPRTSAVLVQAHGVTAASAVQTDDGLTETTVLLDAAGVEAVRALLLDPGAISTAYDSGTLVSVEDARGALESLTLDAVAEHDSTRELLHIDLTYGPMATPVTVDANWHPTIGCPRITTDLVGDWKVAAIAGTATADLGGLSTGRVSFDADGGFSGTSGCQTFSGSAAFGFSWFEDSSVEITGEPCDGLFGALEGKLLGALAGGADVGFDDEGSLLLTDGENVLAVLEGL